MTPASHLAAGGLERLPTHFQASSFPEHWRRKISVIRDGVDLQQACPNPSPAPLKRLMEPFWKRATDRHLREPLPKPLPGLPYVHPAIPELQRLPEAQLVIVGKTQGD